ncbi:hypothetical protein PINS_up005548 [Pythium insidiosum]|nr:hypothetical protein PINS_up005548 [Pythium insidiosum]
MLAARQLPQRRGVFWSLGGTTKQLGALVVKQRLQFVISPFDQRRTATQKSLLERLRLHHPVKVLSEDDVEVSQLDALSGICSASERERIERRQRRRSHTAVVVMALQSSPQ